MISAASASQFAQAQVASDVSLQVAVKAKDIAEKQGDAVISLLQGVADLSQSLARETGKGVRLDVRG